MNEEVCTRFFVEGRVQGVFFRASCVKQAESLGLVGWARNLSDGRVEVLARGLAEDVESLARWLLRGPRMAEVSRLERREETLSVAEGLTDFHTTPTA